MIREKNLFRARAQHCTTKFLITFVLRFNDYETSERKHVFASNRKFQTERVRKQVKARK